MAKRKIGMSNKEKFYRSFGLMSAFFMLFSCFALITFLVMDIIGVNIIENEEGPRIYWVQFISEDRFLVDLNYQRGAVIDKPADPTHSKDRYFEYTFRGWDINNDNSPDIIPRRAYFSFAATAIFQKKPIGSIPRSSREPSSSSSEEENSSSELDYSLEEYPFNEVVSYGA